MCRITAVVSAAAGTHADLLCDSPKSLLAQGGAVKGRYQDDGWGIGRFKGPRPELTLSLGAARLEPAKFRAAVNGGAARVTLAHLRWASSPGVDKAAQVRRENTQPFAAGGYLFAHNGTLLIKDEIRGLLGKHRAKVKGTNDSEVMFRLVLKMLEAYGSPVTALAMAVYEIRAVWLARKAARPDLKVPYRGLNLFLASRDSLNVLCHAPRKKRLPALMTPGWDNGRIAWRRDKDRVVLSSEPADSRPGWRPMNDPEIASVSLRGGRPELAFTPLHL